MLQLQLGNPQIQPLNGGGRRTHPFAASAPHVLCNRPSQQLGKIARTLCSAHGDELGEQHACSISQPSLSGVEQGSQQHRTSRRTIGAAAAAAVAGFLSSAAALPAYALKTVGVLSWGTCKPAVAHRCNQLWVALWVASLVCPYVVSHALTASACPGDLERWQYYRGV